MLLHPWVWPQGFSKLQIFWLGLPLSAGDCHDTFFKILHKMCLTISALLVDNFKYFLRSYLFFKPGPVAFLFLRKLCLCSIRPRHGLIISRFLNAFPDNFSKRDGHMLEETVYFCWTFSRVSESLSAISAYARHLSNDRKASSQNTVCRPVTNSWSWYKYIWRKCFLVPIYNPTRHLSSNWPDLEAVCLYR